MEISKQKISKQKISLILPAFNEELTIKDTILDFFFHFPELNIFVINNASTDKTSDIAIKVFNDMNIKGKVLEEKNKGKGNALRKAFSEINSDIYIICDADTTYKAIDLSSMLVKFNKNNLDMLVGNRHDNNEYKFTNQRKFHNFGNKLICLLLNKMFNANANDVLSGYRVLSKRFIKLFPNLSKGFEIETELTTHAFEYGFKYDEYPIKYENRPEGSLSKLNTFKDGFLVLLSLLNLFRFHRPMLFFSISSLFFLFLSLYFGGFVLYEYYLTNFISHVPLAILATGFALISIVFFVTGMVLESIRRSNLISFILHKNNFNDQK